MFVIKPTPAEEHNFKTKFKLTKGGVVVKTNDEPCASYMVYEKHKYSVDFVRQLLAGMSPDISNLFEKKEDGYYRSQDAVWGKDKGLKVTGKAEICGRKFLLAGDFGSTNMVLPTNETPEWAPIKEKRSMENDSIFDITPSKAEIEAITSKFMLQEDKVVRSGGKPCGAYAVIDNSNYSIDFIKDVLRGETPNITNLFDKKGDDYYRNQNPVWSSRKGLKVNKTVKVCGRTFDLTCTFSGDHSQLESYKYYESLVVPKVLKTMIKKTFKLVDEVVYKNNIPVEHYETLGDSKALYIGNRYPVEFIKDVLENKNPNLNHIFTIDKGQRVRSSHPIWETFATQKTSGNTYRVAGYSIPIDVTKFEEHKYGWTDRVEVVNNRLKYEDQEGLILKIGDKIYSRKYVLELLKGNITTPPIEPFFIKINDQILFGDLACWEDKAMELVDGSFTINDHTYSSKDLGAVTNTVDKYKFLERMREKFSDMEDQEFYYAGELIFTGK